MKPSYARLKTLRLVKYKSRLSIWGPMPTSALISTMKRSAQTSTMLMVGASGTAVVVEPE